MRKHLTILALAGLLCAGAERARADALLSDSTFDLGTPGKYQTPLFSGPNSSTSVQNCTSCGNPGSGLQIVLAYSAAGGPIGAGVINNTLVYNPTTQGTIGSIVASVDKNLSSTATTPGLNFGNFFRPMLAQGGSYYVYQAGVSQPGITAPGTTGYLNFVTGSLTAADFFVYDFSTGTFGAAHPNFSGGPITVGLLQILAASAVPISNFEADYDNLTVRIATVPAPPGWPLPAAGLLLLMWRGWRARQAA